VTPASGVATALSWSQADDLLSYSGPDASGATSGTVTESYGYDGDGLRQTKVTGTQKTHEAYDLSGDLPLMITDGPTAYVTGPGGLPLEQVTAAGTVRWFHHDQLGSTTSLTDAAGATVQSYTYDAYGQPTGATPTVENPFRYAGQYTDDTTGFQNLRARYYDPTTGQFLSRDPIEDTTLQPYAYAGNDPTNASDPSGLWPWSTISNAAAGTLDGLTGGLSTRLAAAYFHFDAECADFGAGFGTGQMLGTVGGFFTGGGEAAAAARGLKTAGGLAAKAGFEAPKVVRTASGEITNGSYTINATKQLRHTAGDAGKSRFLFRVDADQAVLDAAAYADEAGLWVGSKAKVLVKNGPVGVLGRSGEPTTYINLYRTKGGYVHGAPGRPPQ